jgi:DnaJ-class molecular chaperone
MTKSAESDPYAVLGIRGDASPEEVRSAYLSLVRQFPPDRAPERFREIHAAYGMCKDPLVQAQALVDQIDDPPNLDELISKMESQRPRLPKLVLLALGDPQ